MDNGIGFWKDELVVSEIVFRDEVFGQFVGISGLVLLLPSSSPWQCHHQLRWRSLRNNQFLDSRVAIEPTGFEPFLGRVAMPPVTGGDF